MVQTLFCEKAVNLSLVLKTFSDFHIILIWFNVQSNTNPLTGL